MVWVAFDRAVKAVEKHGLDGPVERWRDLRDRVREEILDKGFDEDRQLETEGATTTSGASGPRRWPPRSARRPSSRSGS